MEAEGKLKEIFLKVFNNLKPEDFDLNKKQSEYENWDSFAHMQLISEVGDQFKVNFEVDEVIGIESAKDILDIISKKKNGSL